MAVIRAEILHLHRRYLQRLDVTMQNSLRQMYLDDQKLAAQNLKIADENEEDKFLMERFVPQNERQVKRIYEMILQKGYPGEKSIGNALWASIILNHHNSVSPAYIKQDKLYPTLCPLLRKSIGSGDLSPGDFAMIEDWRITVGSDYRESAYGYLNPLKVSELPKANRLRAEICLPSVEWRNQLVGVQQKIGINFYLEGTTWVKRKIVLQKN